VIKDPNGTACRPGQLQDKDFWNGSCHPDATTSPNAKKSEKPAQQSTYFIK